MSSNRLLAVAGVCVSTVSLSSADTRLSIQHTEPGKEAQLRAVMFTSGK